MQLIDPILQQAGRSYLPGIITEVLRGFHYEHKCLLIFVQFKEHVLWHHVLGIVVRCSLQLRNFSDGAKGCGFDLSEALGDVISQREQLLAMLIEQEVIVTEVETRHVPTEVLDFEVENKDIREESIEAPAILRTN